MKFLLICTLLLALSAAGFAQQTTFVKTDLSQAEIDNIVAKFTQNERKFRRPERLRVQPECDISTIGMGGQITGTFRRDSFMTLTRKAKHGEDHSSPRSRP